MLYKFKIYKAFNLIWVKENEDSEAIILIIEQNTRANNTIL